MNDESNQPSEDQTYQVAAGELKQFVEQYEHLEQEKKDISEQQKDVLSELKGRGYDAKIFKKLIVARKKSLEELSEEEAIFNMYKDALGMG